MRRHARRNVQRIARLAAVGGLLCGGFMVQQAIASEPATVQPGAKTSLTKAADTGSGLVTELGTARTAGNWVDKDGNPVVAVTDDRTAAEVKSAGAKPKMVRFSMDDLRSATETLSDAPKVSGTSWSIDYKNNEVVVQADTTVSKAEWDQVAAVAKSIGGSVRMERTEGTFTTRLNGAEALLSTAGRCSAGFNVTDGKTAFILTAGHCGPVGSIWFGEGRGSDQIGRTVSGSFPGGDYSLIQYANGQPPDAPNVVAVGNGQGISITGTAQASVGQRVFRSGSTTGLRDGQVTALNATVNYPEGTVTGLIETTVCAEPGDSGGPLVSEGLAIGVTSGGSGDCSRGGTTFFQPIGPALQQLGVRLSGLPTGTGGNASAAPPAPSADSSTAPAPGSAVPGGFGPIAGSQGETLLDRLASRESLGPGLLIVAGSLVALVATRWIMSEQDRRAYRRRYSASWG
ncbi:S1 family peptidase [Streptomyces cavernae]|uniref:S1 family peptidase n=1 Tax=Streptomyces cavernae TaxID=2259034 RepID=UPI000FEB84AC|nr:S1 family peptidase [Streptomyces cavernae]